MKKGTENRWIIGFTVRFFLPKRKNAVNLSFVKFH